MRRDLLIGLATLAIAGGALSGCGSSGSDSVSVSEAPPASAATGAGTASTQERTATTTSTPSSSAPAQTTTSGGTVAPSPTRTAPEPAFAQESHAEGVSGAAALLRARGYTPDNTSEYHENQTLRVLLGTRTGSSDGYGQQAFFFLGGHYLGTDTKEPSATVEVVSQSDTEVTLAYPLYRPNDPLSSPSGGRAIVHFQLDNGALTPLGRIPPASSASGLSRN